MTNRRIALVLIAVNAIAVFGWMLAFRAVGSQATDILGVFVYLETLAVVTWYTVETREMQRAVTQQAVVLAHSHLAAVHDNMRNAMMQVNMLFVERPELRPHFYGNVDPDSDSSRPTPSDPLLCAKLESISDSILDIFEGVVRTLRSTPKDDQEYRDAWRRYMRHVAAHSPFLRNHFEKNHSWYVAELRDFLAPTVSGSSHS